MTPAPGASDTDRLLPTPSFPPPRRRRDLGTTAARAWRRTWPWLAALAVVVLVVVTELTLLQGRLRADLARLRDAAGSPTTATAAPGALPPVPVPAPPAAGDVAGVRLRVLDPPCAPGGTCTVVVAVDHRGAAPAAPAAWRVLAVDRCRGTTTDLGAGGTSAVPGAWGIVTVTLPAGRALALVVVTTSPDRAAAAPTPIGAGPC